MLSFERLRGAALGATRRRIHLVLALITSLSALASSAGDAVAQSPPPPSVSLSAPSSVTVPDAIQLTATASSDVGPTPYYIRIYDDDSGAQVASCGSGTTCTTSVATGWGANENPVDRHFHAEVNSSSVPDKSTSGPVAVSVQRYTFDVSLTADPQTVQVPDSFKLTATTNRDVGPTPYYIRIYDDDTGSQVASCGSGTTCQTTVSPGWAPNADPKNRHFHAEVSSSTYRAGNSSQVSVSFRQFFFVVDLTISNQYTDSQGLIHYTVTATTNRDVGPTPYYIKIRNGQGGAVASCGSGTSCAAAGVLADSYRATVEDSSGRIFGTSNVEGFDLSELAALAEASADFCLAIATLPEDTHFERSSAGDLGVKCWELERLGLSPKELLARLLPLGGGTLAAWLAHVETLDDTTTTWPPPPPPPPPYQPEPPQTLPRVWDPPIAATAARIKALNPAVELTDAQTQEIAKRCVWLAAQAIIGPSDCGRETLPIFVTGGNVMKATEHDLRAVGSRPSWMKLNYDGLEKSRTWLATDSRCQGLTGGDTGMHCHEYPYNKTEQGGQSGNPSIEPIPSGENTSQGGSFGAGVAACAMRPAQSSDVRGDAFLVVPVPVETVPTFWLCNGKSASSQPAQPPSPGA